VTTGAVKAINKMLHREKIKAIAKQKFVLSGGLSCKPQISPPTTSD